MILTGAAICMFCRRRERAYVIASTLALCGLNITYTHSACPECAGAAEAYGLETPAGQQMRIVDVAEIPIGDR